MATATELEPLDIKVVYSASGRPARARRARPVSPGGRRNTAWVVLGIFNIAAAGALCWATWWPADRFIFETFVWKTPIPGVDLHAVAGIFGVHPDQAEGVRRDEVPTEEPAESPTFTGETARLIIGGSAYTWLTLATVAACALAMAGGAGLAAAGGAPWRRVGWILSAGAVMGLAWGAYDTWTEFGMEFPTETNRAGMAGLVILCLVVGLAAGRHPRGLSRFAAVMLVLSALVSVGGLLLGDACGAIEPEHSAIGFLAIVFVIHSVYGWILFPVASRLRN